MIDDIIVIHDSVLYHSRNSINYAQSMWTILIMQEWETTQYHTTYSGTKLIQDKFDNHWDTHTHQFRTNFFALSLSLCFQAKLIFYCYYHSYWCDEINSDFPLIKFYVERDVYGVSIIQQCYFTFEASIKFLTSFQNIL